MRRSGVPHHSDGVVDHIPLQEFRGCIERRDLRVGEGDRSTEGGWLGNEPGGDVTRQPLDPLARQGTDQGRLGCLSPRGRQEVGLVEHLPGGNSTGNRRWSLVVARLQDPKDEVGFGECLASAVHPGGFEAAVGGAIPVLSTIEDCTPAAVTAVRGVLNGTANFILTRMAAEGLDYEHVLAEAQDLGVAEADPTFDVDGTDAALKCVILANVLSDGGFSLADADVAGIQDIPPSALELAAEDGETIRLVGEATRDGIRVGPRLVPENGAMAVSGTQNIVQIETRHAGDLYSSGRGAGGPETATAVLSDVGRLP